MFIFSIIIIYVSKTPKHTQKVCLQTQTHTSPILFLFKCFVYLSSSVVCTFVKFTYNKTGKVCELLFYRRENYISQLLYRRKTVIIMFEEKRDDNEADDDDRTMLKKKIMEISEEKSLKDKER